MTTSIVLFALAYGALFGFVATRELPDSLRLPLWVTCPTAAGGVIAAAFTVSQGIGWIRYPVILAAGVIALISVAAAVRPIRSARRADSLAA